MILSTTNNLPSFYQNEYTNAFYYCQNSHPFIAFTTCYCPLCELADALVKAENTYNEMASEFDAVTEKYMELYVKAKHTNPELLI